MIEKNYQSTGLFIYRIIAILEDAKKGYLSAAEKIKDEALSTLLEKFGYRHGNYSVQLELLMDRLAISSSIDQYTLSLLHRTWMDLISPLRYGQKEAVILACIKAEEAAVQNYTMAIEQVQDNDEVTLILKQQVYGIREGLATIKRYHQRQKI